MSLACSPQEYKLFCKQENFAYLIFCVLTVLQPMLQLLLICVFLVYPFVGCHKALLNLVLQLTTRTWYFYASEKTRLKQTNESKSSWRKRRSWQRNKHQSHSLNISLESQANMLTMSLISLTIWSLCLSLAIFGLLSSLKSETELAYTMASLMTLSP